MGIRQESDGTWTALYSKRHPKWKYPISMVRKKMKSKAEAIRALSDLMTLVHKRIAEKVSPPWSKCLESHFEQMKLNGYTEKTIYSEVTCLKKYTDHWSSRSVDSITVSDVHAVISGMHDNTSGHKKFILKCIRGVFSHAVNCGHLDINPTPQIKFKAQDKIMPVLTEAQVKHLLTQARDLQNEWYPHWMFAIFTGMRNGELYALRKSKMNIEDRTILVNESWNNRDGFKSTKSGDDRIVEIPQPLIPVIKDLLARYPTDEFILPRNSRWAKGEQARCLRAFLVGIGLPPVRFHDLRATWATMLLAKGVAPAAVMSMGGWKDMETMMIYMRKAGLDIKGATNCLDKVFNHETRTDNVVRIHQS